MVYRQKYDMHRHGSLSGTTLYYNTFNLPSNLVFISDTQRERKWKRKVRTMVGCSRQEIIKYYISTHTKRVPIINLWDTR